MPVSVRDRLFLSLYITDTYVSASGCVVYLTIYDIYLQAAAIFYMHVSLPE